MIRAGSFKKIECVLLILPFLLFTIPVALPGIAAAESLHLDEPEDVIAPMPTVAPEEAEEVIVTDSSKTGTDPTAAFLNETPLSQADEEDQGKRPSENEDEKSEPQVYAESLYVPESSDWTSSNDPFYSTSGSWGNAYDDLWWLKTVNADDAWSISRGAGVTVAVIDTGIDFNHPDLAVNAWYNDAEQFGLPGFDDDGNGFVDDIRGWDFHNNDNNPTDDHGHGTHVAGIVAAAADNGIGIAGIAPESKIMSLKALNASGSGYIQSVISAIRYAADMGAKVINMSLGIMKNFLSKTLQKLFNNAVQYAVGKGSVVVAAAGNDGANIRNTYPAALSNVIAVGATEPVTNNRAYFSNFGSQLDFVAPGVDILSLRAGNTSFGSNSTNPAYSRASGTSMASPIVAGVVALLRSWNPLLSLTDIYNRLKNSAVDLGSAGFDSYYGYGLVNAFAALTFGTTTSTSASTSATGTSSGGAATSWTSAFGASKTIRSSSLAPGGVSLPHLNFAAFTAGSGSMGNWYVIEALDSESPSRKKKRRV